MIYAEIVKTLILRDIDPRDDYEDVFRLKLEILKVSPKEYRVRLWRLVYAEIKDVLLEEINGENFIGGEGIYVFDNDFSGNVSSIIAKTENEALEEALKQIRIRLYL